MGACASAPRGGEGGPVGGGGHGRAGGGLRNFRRRELEAATRRFRDSALLGQGGFGKVYLGQLKAQEGGGAKLPVAVKRLNVNHCSGYQEWLTEVLILGRLSHKHLVQLIGYCSEGDDAMLVYAYAPRGSLDKALFSADDLHVLSWSQRVKIAHGAAMGLAYLHARNIIHRDLKSSNVLLTEDLTAMLTDFGLAKTGPRGDCTHVSTHVRGTIGYLDPLYLLTGHLTFKSDVYAFGVLLLELLSGRPAVGVQRWAAPLLLRSGGSAPNLAALVDPRLALARGRAFCSASAGALAALARDCLAEEEDLRPTSAQLAKRVGEAWQMTVCGESTGGKLQRGACVESGIAQENFEGKGVVVEGLRFGNGERAGWGSDDHFPTAVMFHSDCGSPDLLSLEMGDSFPSPMSSFLQSSSEDAFSPVPMPVGFRVRN